MPICHLRLRLDLRPSMVLHPPAPIFRRRQVQRHLSTLIPVRLAATPLLPPLQADHIPRPPTDLAARMAPLLVQHRHHPPATVLHQVVPANRTDPRQLGSITLVVQHQTMVLPNRHHLPRAMAHQLHRHRSTAHLNRHLHRPVTAPHLVHLPHMELQV